MFSSYSERIYLSYCFYMRECVGDNTRAGVTTDQSLSYNIKFPHGWGKKINPQQYTFPGTFFSALALLVIFPVYFIYFLILCCLH